MYICMYVYIYIINVYNITVLFRAKEHLSDGCLHRFSGSACLPHWVV